MAYCKSGNRLYPGSCSPSLRQRQKGEQEVVQTAFSLLAESRKLESGSNADVL